FSLPGFGFLCVDEQVFFRFFTIAAGLLQIRLQLTTPLLSMVDALLQACDICAYGVVATLNFIEFVTQFGVLGAIVFDLGVFVHLIGDERFHPQLKVTDGFLFLLGLLIQLLILEYLHLCFEQAFFLFIFGIFFRRLCLTLQSRQLTLHLIADVGQTLEVFLSPADSVFGIAATLFIFGDTGGFLNIYTQVFRLGFNQPRNHALLDDGVAAGPQTGAKENIGDVTTAAFCAIEIIEILPVSGDFALDGDFSEAGILAKKGSITVIKHQLNGGLTDGFATTGAIEDDVGHVLAAQVLRGGFTHYP